MIVELVFIFAIAIQASHGVHLAIRLRVGVMTLLLSLECLLILLHFYDEALQNRHSFFHLRHALMFCLYSIDFSLVLIIELPEELCKLVDDRLF